VPAGALADALTLIEFLDGDTAPGDIEDGVAEIAEVFNRWGEDLITEAFGMIIYATMNMIRTGDDEPDRLHLVVPAVITRFHAMAMPEIPDTVLPTVAGILTACLHGAGPYEWRIGLGPIPRAEGLVWCYTAWLLLDLAESAIENPGMITRILRQVFASDH
jgi:hypothetical protein